MTRWGYTHYPHTQSVLYTKTLIYGTCAKGIGLYMVDDQLLFHDLSWENSGMNELLFIQRNST